MARYANQYSKCTKTSRHDEPTTKCHSSGDLPRANKQARYRSVICINSVEMPSSNVTENHPVELNSAALFKYPISWAANTSGK